MPLYFRMPGHRFSHAGRRVRVHGARRIRPLPNAAPTPVFSRDSQRHFYRRRVFTQRFLLVHFEDEPHGGGQITQAFFLSFPLPIGTRHFQASGPKPTFVRLAAMQDGGELLHLPEVSRILYRNNKIRRRSVWVGMPSPKMKTRYRVLFFFIALVICVVAWLMYTSVHHQISTRVPRTMARVIDGETGKPVSGANIKYLVEIDEGGFRMCAGDSEVFYSYDTTTDTDGRFIVPAWGPKLIPHGWRGDNFSPRVKVQKDGYGIAGETFDFGSEHPWKVGSSGAAVLSAAWQHQSLIIHRNPTSALTDTAPWNAPE